MKGTMGDGFLALCFEEDIEIAKIHVHNHKGDTYIWCSQESGG